MCFDDSNFITVSKVKLSPLISKIKLGLYSVEIIVIFILYD